MGKTNPLDYYHACSLKLALSTLAKVKGMHATRKSDIRVIALKKINFLRWDTELSQYLCAIADPVTIFLVFTEDRHQIQRDQNKKCNSPLT